MGEKDDTSAISRTSAHELNAASNENIRALDVLKLGGEENGRIVVHPMRLCARRKCIEEHRGSMNTKARLPFGFIESIESPEGFRHGRHLTDDQIAVGQSLAFEVEQIKCSGILRARLEVCKDAICRVQTNSQRGGTERLPELFQLRCGKCSGTPVDELDILQCAKPLTHLFKTLGHVRGLPVQMSVRERIAGWKITPT